MEKNPDILTRLSPVTLEERPKNVGRINGFEVALEYEEESQRPGFGLTDLSHLVKWDVQGSDLDRIDVDGEALPSIPGECRIQKTSVLFRMNRTQAGVWHICEEDGPGLPDDTRFTDVSDAWALFGLAGEAVPTLFERITELDLLSPSRPVPMLLQGPVLDVLSRVVLLNRVKDSATALLAFPRGFGQSAAEGLLETGSGIGLQIRGVHAFFNSLKQLNILNNDFGMPHGR